MDIMSLPNIGRYIGVSYDRTRMFEESGRAFRIAVHGAYNALGLIGSEYNGVVIFDNDQQLVLCDKICQIDSGFYGPSQIQTSIAKYYAEIATWEEFQSFVNSHSQSRYQL